MFKAPVLLYFGNIDINCGIPTIYFINNVYQLHATIDDYEEVCQVCKRRVVSEKIVLYTRVDQVSM